MVLADLVRGAAGCPAAKDLVEQGACDPGPDDAPERRLAAAVLQAYPRLGKCAPCFDSRLSRVASVLARSAGPGLGGTSALQRAMLTAGVGDVAPSGFLAEGSLDRVCEQIVKNLTEGHDDNVFGVAYVARSAGFRAVVVRARREVAVEPLPTSIPIGGSLSIRGKLLGALGTPSLYVESPDGQVQQLTLKQKNGFFETRLELRAEGFYTLEIMGKGRTGPEVAWMMGLSVGRASPLDGPPVFETGPLRGADDERAVLEEVNQQRLRAGVPALAEDPQLSQIANAYAAELRELHLFAHVSPRSGDLKARLQRANYPYVRGGENLAQGPTALEAADLAAQSPAHRKNLLDPGYDRCGIGISRAAGDVILVELFVVDR
jgi:uncharacterized protein YkwD